MRGKTLAGATFLAFALTGAAGVGAQVQTIPPVFIPFNVANQQLFAGRFNDSISGFFSLVSDGLFQQQFPRVNQGFEEFQNEARASVDEVPIPSGSVSVAYTFDSKLETYVRQERPFAPVLSLNARTDGKGVLTLGTAYSYVNYETFNGEDRKNVVFPAPLGVTDIFGNPVSDQVLFNFKLQQSIYTVALSYGLLDNVDVGVLIPVIKESFRGSIIERFFSDAGAGFLQPATLLFDGNGNIAFVPDPRLPTVPSPVNLRAYNVPVGDLPLPGVVYRKNTYGVGDLLLRTKAFLGTVGGFEVGSAVSMALPTGDEDNLLGVGSVRFEPALLISTSSDRFALHTNQGVHVDVDDHERDRYDYTVGGELLLTRWATLLLDQVGHLEFSGQDKVQKFEVVPGLKVNPYGNVIVGFNAILPLNRDGLRTDYTPNATVEISKAF
jgi:hypothetical protein